MTADVSKISFDTISRYLKQALKSSDTNEAIKANSSVKNTEAGLFSAKRPDPLATHNADYQAIKRLFQRNINERKPLKKTSFSRPYFLWNTAIDSDHDELIFERFDDEIILIKNLNLSLEGTLKKLSNGFCFLDIPDELIQQFSPYITQNGAENASFPMGAHIPVISCSESRALSLQSLQEEGQSFSLTLKSLIKVKPCTGDYESIWAIEVCCDQLSLLREKYRLPSKLCSSEFMITLGAKTKLIQQKPDLSSSGYFKINPAIQPA